MPSIAITGGIACGKSYATDYLANKLQIIPFDADQEASNLLHNDPEVVYEIKKNWGPSCYTEEGKPDRKRLRELMTHSSENKFKLETILHPRLRKKWGPQAMATLGKDDAFFLAEIPLLYENDLASFFDAVIVVAASEHVQLTRLVEERKLSYHGATSLIHLQQPLSKKIILADYVLWNDGTKESLQEQLHLLSSTISNLKS